jgi:CRP-like cAMP-binding protein
MGLCGSSQKPIEMVKEGESVVDFLRKNAFFRDVKEVSQLEKAARAFEIVRINLKHGETKNIIKRGDIGDCLYIVARGQVEVSASDEKGGKLVLRKLVKQDVFTEIGFIHNVPSTVDMDAVKEQVVLLKLSKGEYLKHKQARYMRNLTEWLDATAGHMVASSLKNVPMLSGVPDDKLATVAKLFELRVVEMGETVFKEGDAGDSFYILTKGRLVVTTVDQNGQFVELSRLKAGQSFGEISLVDDQPRTATITALEESTLFSLSRSQFGKFLELVPSMAEKIRKNINERSAVNLVAKKIPFFQTLGPNKLHLLGTVSKIVTYRPGSTIMMEGRNKPAKFFIITQGEVEVTVKDKVVRTMGQGDYFGEISLVSGRDATATVTAVGKESVLCLEIARDDFDALFVSEPAALAEIQIKVLGASCELKHILPHPVGRKYFAVHSAEQFATENIDFWTDVEDLERMWRHRLRPSIMHAMGQGAQQAFEKKKAMLIAKVNAIYEKYIMDNCAQPINIKSNVRALIIKRIQLEDYESDMFKVAKQEIYDLMSLDVFSRFKHSDAFKRMLDEIGVYGSFAGEDLGHVKVQLDQRSKSVLETTLQSSRTLADEEKESLARVAVEE